jgi:hypothetical protein
VPPRDECARSVTPCSTDAIGILVGRSMAAEWLQICLRAWAPDAVVGDGLETLLRLEPGDGFRSAPGTALGQASLIYFVDEEVAAFASAKEPSEAFAAAVEARLLASAKWLASRPAGALDACRAQGYRLDVFVGSWIDQDQFDLDLPAEFLLACGSGALGISIVTND